MRSFCSTGVSFSSIARTTWKYRGRLSLVGRIDREIDVVAADGAGDALLQPVLVRAEAAIDGVGHLRAFDDGVLELFGRHAGFLGAAQQQADGARLPGNAAAQHDAAAEQRAVAFFGGRRLDEHRSLGQPAVFAVEILAR